MDLEETRWIQLPERVLQRVFI
ncbi:hypothetical protein CIB84_011569 [Bambusicola thoracicus]|uniref:Uncharacterized protein n=1 Tax=Bambusicola thoracicus TaxID=9083 RepID=A0A2P4SKP8_BAMTH|nr:hypothetical protein CIB84_011569 [Bambusicola thoracicus]